MIYQNVEEVHHYQDIIFIVMLVLHNSDYS